MFTSGRHWKPLADEEGNEADEISEMFEADMRTEASERVIMDAD